MTIRLYANDAIDHAVLCGCVPLYVRGEEQRWGSRRGKTLAAATAVDVWRAELAIDEGRGQDVFSDLPEDASCIP